jgi:hypothetical protein
MAALKALKNPPMVIRMVLDAVLILRQRSINKVQVCISTIYMFVYICMCMCVCIYIYISSLQVYNDLIFRTDVMLCQRVCRYGRKHTHAHTHTHSLTNKSKNTTSIHADHTRSLDQRRHTCAHTKESIHARTHTLTHSQINKKSYKHIHTH